MKRYPLCISLLTFLAGSFTLPVMGSHISADQALARLQKSSKAKALTGKTSAIPTLQSTLGNLYIFSGKEGYMVLPADDRAPALLGYSDKGTFSLENNPALSYWLEFYNKEIASLSDTDKPNTRPLKAADRPERSPIAPLTKTRWNQEAPYNDKCPIYEGRRSVTGCVATAMAQVMKYHNYPEKGKGSHTYKWPTGGTDLSYDFSTTTFDWSNMTDTYNDASTQVQKDAVATLMLACGISVDMDYTPGESSAASVKMGSALLTYFDYDNALWMPMRDFYGLYEWEDMIYADLEKGLPVLYAGQGTAGGHQFICDGYSSDGYFHFNWGWGGLSDGYFLLTALNPANLGVGGGAGGFNTDQQIALGVQPPVAGSKPHYLMYCTGDFTTTATEVAFDDLLPVAGGFYNYSMMEMDDKCAMGVRIVAQDGSYDKYLESHKVSGLPPYYGYKEYNFRFPSLPEGNYTIYPAFYNGEEWSQMPVGLGKTGSIIATVVDGGAVLSSPAPDTITVTDIEVPSSIYQNCKFPLSFSIVNNDDTEYIGKVIPILVGGNNQMVAQSVYRPVDILGNDTESVSDYIGDFKAVQGASYTPGTYSLIFCSENGNAISDPVTVTVLAAPTSTSVSLSDFRLVSENPVTDKSKVEFGFDLTCTEGYFSDHIIMYIFPYRNGNVYSVASGTSPMLYIPAGETKSVITTLDLSNLEPGKYFTAAYYGGKGISNQLVFEISQSTGISFIENDKATRPISIFNLQGQPCQDPLQPGIYIMDGKKVMVK
ncbi:MAG: C10 family peptidase [Muribaculaceae bacterium]|nr:C10 family peptidase [Muribaculaceae bacterium]